MGFSRAKERKNGNTELIHRMMRKYGEGDYDAVENVSLDIPLKERTYKLVRLNDEQYYFLQENSISILDDYMHLMFLSLDETLFCSSLSKMYSALKALFGESGRYYDYWKGSFSFPFLIHFSEEDEDIGYLMNVCDIKSSIYFRMAKLVRAGDKKFRRDRAHDPLEEFSRREMNYCINYFAGFLSGYFSAAEKLLSREFFFRAVRVPLVLYGCRDGRFFDCQYESEDELDEALEELESLRFD